LLEQMQTRLEELKSELEAGEAELARVENHRMYLRETLLRISGAVQVMEELLAEGQSEGRSTEQRDGPDLGASSQQSETQLSSIRTNESKQAR
jgi:predicted nuclease with TOPRIM domain